MTFTHGQTSMALFVVSCTLFAVSALLIYRCVSGRRGFK